MDTQQAEKHVKLQRYCICIWQNVLGTHDASVHGGSSDLIVKILDKIILKRV